MTHAPSAATEEMVVLADENGNPCGTAPKATIHTADTPLHFAFSAYLLEEGTGRLLMSRRALSKKTWPGVWTNSFCGHPGQGETPEAAVVRRAHEELGIDPSDLGPVVSVLPDFQYRAVDSSGIVEYEICPVFTVTIAQGAQFTPVPDEIDSFVWADPKDVIAAVDATGFAFSPWLIEELDHPELRRALAAS